MGLDIEVSYHTRKGKFPFPYNDITGIFISNAGWYDGESKDVCYSMYYFGKYTGIELEENRTPSVINAKNSTRIYGIAYKILEKLSPDIVNIHNGFGFDLKRIAVHSSLSPMLTETTERRELGNSRSWAHGRLYNVTAIIDSMYDVDKYLRSKWESIFLASMAKSLWLPPEAGRSRDDGRER